MQPGTRVRLSGLSSSGSILNGAEGTITGGLTASGRYPVRISTPSSAVAAKPSGVAVKPQNLEVVVEAGAFQEFELTQACQAQVVGPARHGDPRWTVDAFVRALNDDVYPDKVTERIFGIQLMEPDHPTWSPVRTWPIGKVMLSAWQAVHTGYIELKMDELGANPEGWDATGQWELGKNITQETQKLGERVTADFKGELVQALLAGRLPAWFEGQVRTLAASKRFPEHLKSLGPNNTFLAELVRRGFACINYNSQRLGAFAVSG